MQNVLNIEQIVEQAVESNDSILDVGIVFGDPKYNTQYDIIVDKEVSTVGWNNIVATAKQLSDTHNIFVTGRTDNNDPNDTHYFRFGQELA